MKIEIKHWTTNAVLFAVECGSVRECVETAVKKGVNLDGANLSGALLIGARLSGASLVGANLSDARLDGASLSDANLSDANLSDARLVGARLVGARLVGANLDGANHVIALGQPNGFHAFAWLNQNIVMAQVACKSFTLAEGRAYWRGKDNRREVMAALDYAEAVANLREWVK